MMGGEVRVESRVGEGSTFSFTMRLPLDLHPAPAGVPKAQVDGVRCIVVDDVPVNRRIVRELTNSWRMRPDEADSADVALRMMREAAAAGDPYDFALLDLRMPDVDGEELGRRIRADETLKHTLMVLLTSATERGLVSRFTAAGFHGVLVKPFRASDLHDALATVWAERGCDGPSRLVTRHTLVEARAASAPEPAPVGDDAAPMPRAGLRVLIAEDNPVNQKVAVKMLKKLDCSVDVAANGAEAVDMATKFPYDAVFMDCQMPEMDGYEATRAITQALRAERRPRIIAMTANAMEGDREKCLAAGMDDYVPKPIKPDAIRAALLKVPTGLSRRQTGQMTTAQS
jgi:CheY-like chemotaxis protein